MRDASYEAVVRNLFDLLDLANQADHEDAQPWQRPQDAGQGNFYGRINEALKLIAGRDIVDHWNQTHEVDMSLASRRSNP